MMHFSPLKTAFVIGVCCMGILFSIPNLIGDRARSLPDWLQPVSLGLDLQGGSHLLLETGVETVINERLEATLDAVRQELRKDRIRYKGLKLVGMPEDSDLIGRAVSVTLDDYDAADKARRIVRKIDPEMTTQVNGKEVLLGFGETAHINQINKVVEQSIEIVRRRIDELGTREPTIQRQGERRILVQLPGVSNPEEVKRLLGKTAKMTFHLVDSKTSPMDARRGKMPPGSKIYPGAAGADQGSYVLRRRVVVGGEHLIDSQPAFAEGEAVVSFRFDAVGARTFGRATKDNIGERLAILLDGEVISAPVIRSAILGGNGQISGSFTSQSARDLSLLLRAGALPAPLKVLEERTVGPGLGQDSIRAGAIASALGLCLVVIFMVLAYGLFGLFADVVLFANMFLLMGGLSFLGATLTLPGIAGIVLTMGMAVDANVLIFERMREEIRLGRSAFNAAESGFKHAFKTILDSNITTLVASIVLFQFGSGPVRGFAVTLGLGILTSLFTAVMLSRLIVSVWIKRKKPETLPI